MHRYLQLAPTAPELGGETMAREPGKFINLLFLGNSGRSISSPGFLVGLTYRRNGYSNSNIARQDFLVSGSLTSHVSEQEAVKRMALGSFLRQLVSTPVGSPPLPRKSCINSAL